MKDRLPHRLRVLATAVAWISLTASPSVAQAVRLTLSPPLDGSPRREIRSEGGPAAHHVLERSSDLRTWSEVAVVHDGPFRFPVELAPGGGFFRARSRVRTADDDGKNAIVLPEDAFANVPANPFDSGIGVRWVKFLILLDDPGRVWFQDSAKHPFHVQFARLRIPAFAGMTPEQFDAVTLRHVGRRAILGSVLIAPESAGNEFGIQFVSADPLPAAAVAGWFHTVAAVAGAPEGSRWFYVPTFEQASVARDAAAELASLGVVVGSAERWVSGDQAYSEGWAVGRLRWVPGDGIVSAYGDGRLVPGDVLLTDAVPAEIPFVAGIVSLLPATPNSHVALLARSYGVPFGYPASEAIRDRLREWDGVEVALRVGSGGVEVVRLDGDNALPQDLRDELLSLKRPDPLTFPPRARMGVHATNVTSLTPAHLGFVGGKAANHGLLRRVLPTNSPPAIALTLDLWDDFLAQRLGTGRTLSEELRLRLGGFGYPPDMARLRPALEGVRNLIRREAVFAPELRASVVTALQASGLPLDRKIRFRSSTNLEDTDQFSGAGLYDSYSGCLTDDLDGDASGPSACDPAEPEERGVFRAIQRVYASLYNENAFLERRRLGVDEDAVGMAVLVAESFPDPDELANGVATLDWSNRFGFVSGDLDLVLQPGAESVTNPDSAARPERVGGFVSGTTPYLEHRQGSGLVPLGARVLSSDAEYDAFARMFLRVASAYRTQSGKDTFTLDFEFKKSASRGLQVKQVREVPRPAARPAVTAFLLPQAAEFVVEQGEYGSPMAIHRMKSRWRLDQRPIRATASGLAATPSRGLGMEIAVDGARYSWTNGPGAWTGVAYRTNSEGFLDAFDPVAGLRLELQTVLNRTVPSTAAPILFPTDLARNLVGRHASPRPELDWETWTTTREDFVRLVRPIPITPASRLQVRRWTNSTGALRIESRFWWPERIRETSAGYTAPNLGFVETRIEGLVSVPIVLHGYWSQTYSPEHHNFSENFLFEPRLEEGLPAAVLNELEAAGIRVLHVWHSRAEPWFTVVGPDGTVRRLP